MQIFIFIYFYTYIFNEGSWLSKNFMEGAPADAFFPALDLKN